MFRLTILEGKAFKIFILDLIKECLLAKIPSEFFTPLIELPVFSCSLACFRSVLQSSIYDEITMFGAGEKPEIRSLLSWVSQQHVDGTKTLVFFIDNKLVLLCN